MSAVTTGAAGSGGSIGFYIVAFAATVFGILLIVFRDRVTGLVDRLSGRQGRDGWRPGPRYQAPFGVGFLILAVIMVFLARAAAK
ncbi:hypothetical protein [Terrabacter sp. 2YAF2]|uniref:hypothetical protein n=1 Tax=Terrabacter sp. 2YAF2 TaxID=3233026 RepID=UPI003F9E16BE